MVRRWVLLSVAALVLSGCLALGLLVGRVPMFSRRVTDPAFFKRCLVVHVDLSLTVWLFAYIGALLALLPRTGASALRCRGAVFVSGAGVVLMLSAAGAPGALPVLSNYVPMIDHWLFAAGLALFGFGVVLGAVDRRLLPWEPTSRSGLLSDAAVPGLRATGIVLLLTALTFIGSYVAPRGPLSKTVLFELANWGGGHVMQLCAVTAMVTVWLLSVGAVTGEAVLPRSYSSALFGLLVLPWLSSPLLALRGIQDVAAREVFTDLMRWGIFPVVLVFLLACSRALVRARRMGRLTARQMRDPLFVGFIASAVLCLLGWILGALIRGSNTMVPAHYHAAIGAVTVSFMAFTPALLKASGVVVVASRRSQRLALWQPALFATGQFVFAVGFAWAGAYGMGRKLYGPEQNVERLSQTVGLSVMGLGGLLAVAGGLCFLALVTSAFYRHARRLAIDWVPRAPEPGGMNG